MGCVEVRCAHRSAGKHKRYSVPVSSSAVVLEVSSASPVCIVKRIETQCRWLWCYGMMLMRFKVGSGKLLIFLDISLCRIVVNLEGQCRYKRLVEIPNW